VLRDLHKQLRGDGVEKTYIALAEGSWPRHLRLVTAALHRNQLQSGERMVRVATEGKPSETRFRVVERFNGATLIAAQPLTGRTHQIRVHAQHAGHALLGDSKYGAERGELLARELGLKRLFLHAQSLRFQYGDRQLQVSAPLADDLEQCLAALRRRQICGT